ncbi:MAG TPA: hypothetical protein VG754_04005 [Verrucomicrobiae bacterium]|nr:hypothetical protein [Verrucomicrobiae bacterium]
MNDRKLKKLFELGRDEVPPRAPEGFEERVSRALRSERPNAPVSFWEQIEALFPRVAIAAVLVMGCCLAAELSFSAAHPAGLSADVSELSDQWLFAGNND